MKKSSLKNYIALLEAAADSATHARDYWMREHERRVEELLEADAVANASDHWMRQYELKDKELLKAKDEIAVLKRRLIDSGNRNLKAKDEIAELRRRLDDNGGLCTLRAKLTGETCKETHDRLREDNERLSRLLRYHRHNHNFERNHDGPQA